MHMSWHQQDCLTSCSPKQTDAEFSRVGFTIALRPKKNVGHVANSKVKLTKKGKWPRSKKDIFLPQ
jgi:hypothetical protein